MAATIAVIVFLLVGLVCLLHTKTWPEGGETLKTALAAASTCSGLKIVIFTLLLNAEKLGPLADDRPALILGGLATVLFGARETYSGFRAAANLP